MTTEFYIASVESNKEGLTLRGAADGKICRDTVFAQLCTRIVVKDAKGIRLEQIGIPQSVQVNVLKLITYELDVEELFDQTGALIVAGEGLELIKAGDTLVVG